MIRTPITNGRFVHIGTDRVLDFFFAFNAFDGSEIFTIVIVVELQTDKNRIKLSIIN